MPKKDKKEVQKLYQAILSLQTAEECAAFFDDICTIQELEALSQRFQVACELQAGKSYIDINKSTGASTATICRVSKCLNYGDGGYKTAIDRIGESNDDN